MKTRHWTHFLLIFFATGAIGYWIYEKIDLKGGTKTFLTIGQEIDHLNDVAVYYNAEVGNVKGRNTTADGYNLGLMYQCVEFVKRYYYEHLNHKMPNSYGHAKDLFNQNLSDGQKSTRRNLTQYTNPSRSKPKVNDLLVYRGTAFNQYGHVAIVSEVTENNIEVIQQNPGPYGKSRVKFSIRKKNGL